MSPARLARLLGLSVLCMVVASVVGVPRAHRPAVRLRQPRRTSSPSPAPPPSESRLGGVVATLALCAFLAFWFQALRPQYLGGTAGYLTVAGNSMEPGLSTGDVVVVHRRASYRRGDVVAYRVPAGQPGAGRVVIHRIVGGSAAEGYVLRGDNRSSNDAWRPRRGDVIGRQSTRVPGLGRAARTILTPVGLGLLAGLTVTAVMLTAPPRRDPA